MHLKQNDKFLANHPALILLLFLLLAYLPVLLPFFHIKNDLVSQNLPARFFISESLYSQTFPWWNPFVNYGIPQYGDMNSGFWNPVLWLIAKTFGYNVLTITLEEMFYILVGGWGVFKIARYFNISMQIALLCGLSYMSGGYIVGHLQHFCWITGTAFFPYVLLFFIRSIDQPILKNFIAGGLFSFLFVSSTHPGLIIGALYFFVFVVVHLLLSTLKDKQPEKWKTIIKSSLLFGLVSALFSTIVIVSNVEVLQHITRGSKVTLQEALSNPTTLQSYFSLLFPFAVHQGKFFQTDISMRNMSIGITLLPGIWFFVQNSNLKKNWILLMMLFFFIFLAAGGIFKLFAYNFLPYLGFVRLNGEFSYFPYIIIILASAYGLSKISLSNANLINRAFGNMLIFFVTVLLICLVAIFISHNSILFSKENISFTEVKNILNELTFWDLLFISIILQGLSVFLLKQYRINSSSFLVTACINLVLICWGCLPYTGLGQKPRKEVQAIIQTFPKGINKPFQKTVSENIYIDVKYDTIIGSSAFYSKQIGYPSQAPYPVLLKHASIFYNNDSLLQFINNQSFLFLATDTTIKSQTTNDSSLIKIIKFKPTLTRVQVQNNGFKYLTFLQNNYPRWEVSLDGKPIQHFTVFKTFIGITIPSGNHVVEFRFNTTSLEFVLWINVLILFIVLFLLTQKRIINKPLFQPKQNN